MVYNRCAWWNLCNVQVLTISALLTIFTSLAISHSWQFFLHFSQSWKFWQFWHFWQFWQFWHVWQFWQCSEILNNWNNITSVQGNSKKLVIILQEMLVHLKALSALKSCRTLNTLFCNLFLHIWWRQLQQRQR